MASSSSSGGSRTPTTKDTLAVPGQAHAPSNRPAEVKRRKSGFGALFGFGGGGDKSASRSRSVSGATTSSLTQSGRSHSAIPERHQDQPAERPRQTLKRVDERQREPVGPTQKLSRERAHSSANDSNGGLFGRGKSARPDPNGWTAPAPPKGAAPAAKAKKDAAPFYHPSQMLHAAEPEPAARPRGERQSSGVRAINASPMPSPRPGDGGHSFSGYGPQEERSSNGSSTAYNSSLSSSTSTFPPNKPGRQAPAPQTQPQQQQQRKGALSSLLSSYGSVRSRTRSSPAIPPTAKFDGRDSGRMAPPVARQLQQQQQQ